jgi:hypothetical protein
LAAVGLTERVCCAKVCCQTLTVTGDGCFDVALCGCKVMVHEAHRGVPLNWRLGG